MITSFFGPRGTSHGSADVACSHSISPGGGSSRSDHVVDGAAAREGGGAGGAGDVASKIEQMVEMGFKDRDLVAAALVAAGGRVEAAIAHLMGDPLTDLSSPALSSVGRGAAGGAARGRGRGRGAVGEGGANKKQRRGGGLGGRGVGGVARGSRGSVGPLDAVFLRKDP